MEKTLNIPDNEYKQLEVLAQKKGMSVEKLIQQSYRFYHDMEVGIEKGHFKYEEVAAIINPMRGMPMYKDFSKDEK